MTLNNNELYGSYGGCYANCDARVYADKGVQLSSCSSPSDCKNRAGGLEFVHICPCYDDGSGSSTLLSVWEIIGISAGVFFFLLIVMGLAIYFCLRKRFEYFSFASLSTARMFLHSQKHSFTRGMWPSGNSGRTHARTDAQTAGSVSRAPTAHP